MKTQFIQIDADAYEWTLLGAPLEGLFGTKFNLGIIFVRNGVPIMFPTSPNPVPGMLSIKEKGLPSGDALLFLGDWEIEANHYLFSLSLDVPGVATALGDADTLECSLAVRWQPQDEGDHVARCFDIPIVIHNSSSRSEDYQPE